MKYLFILHLLLTLIGVHYFNLGFFLQKDQERELSLDERTDPQVSQVIFMIVDSLRSDFTINNQTEVNDTTKNYLNQFPIFRETMQKYPTQTAFLRSYADPPTVTLQRIKGLITGALQSFIEVLDNLIAKKVPTQIILKKKYTYGPK